MGGIAAFFARPLVQIGGVSLLIFAVIVGWNLWLSDVENDAREAGIAEERAAGAEFTLNQVEKAHEVRRNIDDPASRARYDECLRSATNPANCKRFLPQ